MKVHFIEVRTSNFTGEKTLRDRFIHQLQEIVANGGSIISITKDDRREKSAYVLKKG